VSIGGDVRGEKLKVLVQQAIQLEISHAR
jgi:hypothetical protein